MILEALALVAGTGAGFVASRRLRRPDRAAQAASVARNVGGSLGRRKGLTPPELQRACFSEMVRHVQVTRSGRTSVPARFVIRMHPDDIEMVMEGRRWFTEGLIEALRSAAREQNWQLSGKVAIDYEPDPGRRPGVPTALAFAPGAEKDGPAAAPPAARERGGQPAARPGGLLQLVRSDNGESIPLRGDRLTIGRSRDRDITIDDSRISRSHAHLERHQKGWVVIDDGSANGSRLDGRDLDPHTPATIRNGSVIGVGPVDLRVRPVDADRVDAAEPGTRALDDGDRHRISREYLPPEPRR